MWGLDTPKNDDVIYEQPLAKVKDNFANKPWLGVLREEK